MNYNTNKNPVEIAGSKNNRQNDVKRISHNRGSYDIEINISVGSGYNKSSERRNAQRNEDISSTSNNSLMVLYVIVMLLFVGFPLIGLFL